MLDRKWRKDNWNERKFDRYFAVELEDPPANVHNLLPCFVQCSACVSKLLPLKKWLELLQKEASPSVLGDLGHFVTQSANRKDPYIRDTLQTPVTRCYLSIPFLFNRKGECHFYFEYIKYAQNMSAIARAYAIVARDLDGGSSRSTVGEALLSTYIGDILYVAHYLAVGMEEDYSNTLVSRTLAHVYSCFWIVRDLAELKSAPRGVMNSVRGYDLDLSIGSIRTVPAPAPGTIATTVYDADVYDPLPPPTSETASLLPITDMPIIDRFSYASHLARAYLYILDPSRLPLEHLDAIKNRYIDTSATINPSRSHPNYDKNTFTTPTIELTAEAPGYSQRRRLTPVHGPDHKLCLPRNFLCQNSPFFGCMLMRENFRKRGLNALTICDTWYDHLRFWAILAYSLPKDNPPSRPFYYMSAVHRAGPRTGHYYHTLHVPLIEVFTVSGPTTDDAKELLDQLFHVVDVHLGAYALANRFLMGDMERRLRRDLIPDLYTLVHVCTGNLVGDMVHSDPSISCGSGNCPCDLFEEIIGSLSGSGFAEAVHDFVNCFVKRLPLLLWSGTGRSPTPLTIHPVLDHFIHHLLSLGCPAVEDFLDGILRCVVDSTKNFKAWYEDYLKYVNRK